MNPVNGPSRRPDYLVQKGPNPEQDNLLISRLIGSNSNLLKATRPNLPLYEVVKYQLCEVVKMAILYPLGNIIIDFWLCDITGPKLAIIAGS